MTLAEQHNWRDWSDWDAPLAARNPVALAATTVEDLKASGMWKVVTPDECVELARTNGSVALHPLMGGMPPELGWESLQLYVDRVLPQLTGP